MIEDISRLFQDYYFGTSFDRLKSSLKTILADVFRPATEQKQSSNDGNRNSSNNNI